MNESTLNHWTWPMLLLVIVCSSGCYEDREGCLDADAANFNLDADVACDNCCSLPEMVLDIRHRITEGDTLQPLQLETYSYTDSKGDTFRLAAVRYYVSDLRLVLDDGRELSSLDILTALHRTDGSTLRLANAFALVDPAAFATYPMGTFRGTGSVVAVKLDVGLRAAVEAIDPTSVPDDHPLHLDRGMYQDAANGYRHQLLGLYRTAADTLAQCYFLSEDRHYHRYTFPLNDPFPMRRGQDVRVLLEADYGRWLDNLCALTDNAAEISDLLAENLDATALYLVEVSSR